jgi:uncharacterized membrane protein YdjX (TVP38/TMEM64 family)
MPPVVWLRLSLFVALLLAGFALVRLTPYGEMLSEEGMVSLATQLRGVWWSPLILIGLYTIMAVLGLPTGPLLIGGAVFGVLYGSLYNMVGLLMGAVLSYQVARILGRDFVVQITGKRLQRAERLLERHGFWPMVQTRFMPIPFAVVNFGAALAGVRPSLFLSATVVGLIPSTLIHTYFIAELFAKRGPERATTLVWYASTFVLFNVVISILWLREHSWWKRHISGGFASILRSLIRRIDRYLRRKKGIFEFWDDPECLFRVSITHTPGPLNFPGGAIPAGAKMLELHYWNEHLLHLPFDGTQVAPSRKMFRMAVSSLRVLADRIGEDQRLTGVELVGGATPQFTAGSGSSAEKVYIKLGFTVSLHRNAWGAFGRFWENVYALMLRWTFNPATLQNTRILRTIWSDFWISTDDFVHKYTRLDR